MKKPTDIEILRKLMPHIGNKISTSTQFSNWTGPLVDIFIRLARSKETTIRSVKDYKTSRWGTPYTAENVREESRNGRSALSTFASCWDVELQFEPESATFLAKVTVFDGDNVYGHRKDTRLSIVMEVDDKYIVSEHIRKWIEDAFNSEAGDLYEAFLEQKKLEWIASFREGVIHSKGPTKSKQET